MDYYGGTTVKQLKREILTYKNKYCEPKTNSRMKKAELERIVDEIMKKKSPMNIKQKDLEKHIDKLINVSQQSAANKPKIDISHKEAELVSDELIANIEKELNDRKMPEIDLIPVDVLENLHEKKKGVEAHENLEALLEVEHKKQFQDDIDKQQKEILENVGDKELLLIAAEAKRKSKGK